MPALAGLSLSWLLAFGPPPVDERTPRAELRVELIFPEGTQAPPKSRPARFECPDQPELEVEIDARGVASVSGPAGALCALTVEIEGELFLAVVELGSHSFETAEATSIGVLRSSAEPSSPEPSSPEATAPKPSRGLTIAGTTSSEAHYVVEGVNASRDFTSVVDVAQASRVVVSRSMPGSAEPAKQPFHPGTLTAGAVDDLSTRRGFEAFASTVPGLSESFGSQWAAVRVVDQRGRPVRGVPVWVDGPEGRVTLRTRADGHAVFVAGYDGLGDVHRLQARIDRGPAVKLATGRTVVGRVRRVEEPIHNVDLALVLDTTGSMADELAYLQTELRAILEDLEREYRQLDVRFALIVYRDVGDAYTVRGLDFTRDFDRFEATLADQLAGGGGDNPEAVHTAFEAAGELECRPGTEAARVLMHVADAPPHPQQMDAALQAVDALRKQGTAVYPVAASGTDGAAEFFMRASALMTAGQYVFLTNDSGYGNDHREASQACFDVSTLADVLTSILTAQLEAERAQLPRGFDSRCNPNRRLGPPRDRPTDRSVQDWLGHSLMDDHAASEFLHTPYVRRRL